MICYNLVNKSFWTSISRNWCSEQ